MKLVYLTDALAIETFLGFVIGYDLPVPPLMDFWRLTDYLFYDLLLLEIYSSAVEGRYLDLRLESGNFEPLDVADTISL